MNKTLAVLLTLLGATFAYYLWTQLEYYEEEVDVGYSVEAYLNPYLAAEQYLQAAGHDVEGDYRLELDKSLPDNATLFISDANDVLDQRRADNLIAWMQNGGQVIVAAQLLNEGEDDVFLKTFGVKKYSYEDETALDTEGDNLNDEEKSLGDRIREANKQFSEEEKKRKARQVAEKAGRLDTLEGELTYEESLFDDSDIAALTFDDVEGEVHILIDREEYLDHPSFYTSDDEYDGYKPFYWQGNDTGVNFMQFDVGHGLLTVIGDGSIWSNKRIGLFDHAYLLDILTENTLSIVFLRGAEVPSLFELMWSNYREVCVVLTLLLFLWLVYRARRFGPVLDTSDRGRRSYREHLSAVGDFYWRHKYRDELLDHAREIVWREFSRKHFSARNASKAEKYQRLAGLTDYSLEYIQSAMGGEPPHDEYKFYQLIQSLQKIRKKL